jgi:hypothetical protein
MSIGIDIWDVIERHSRAALDEIAEIIRREEGVDAALVVTPTGWKKSGELEGQSYRWPEDAGGLQKYGRFDVYDGGSLTLGVGYLDNETGKHIAVFKMGAGGGSKRPIVYFQKAADPTDEWCSPIRGKNGGKAFFAPGDQLPPDYDGVKYDLFRDRIPGRFRVWCVVAKEHDVETMLNHAAAQIRLREL